MSKMLTEVSRDATGLDAISQEAEIERRLEELRRGQVKPVPLEEVKRRMEAEFASITANTK